jgi:hypothetical protein
LVSGIFGNMLPRLYETDEARPLLVASFIRDSLVRDVEEVRASPRWRLIGGTPTEELDSIEQTLWDLHDIAVERELGGSRGAQALLKAARLKKQGTARHCGQLARSRIERHLASDLERLVKEAKRKGHNVQVSRHESVKKGFLWPPDEITIFVEVESLMEWGQGVHDLSELSLRYLGDLRKVLLVPIRLNRLIPWLAFTVREGSPVGTEWVLDDWTTELPCEVLDGEATNLLERLFSKLDEATSVASGVVNGQLPEEELTLLLESMQDSRTAYKALVEVAEKDSTDVLATAIGADIDRIVEMADSELEKLQNDEVPVALFVEAVKNHLQGQQDELFNTLVGCRMFAAEWDLDPLNARILLEGLDE